jgi:hypothetical protein
LKKVYPGVPEKKRLVVSGHQPNYLPWLGFFDKMLQCDLFIIEDDVQFEQQGFQNRNRVKTTDETKWLTVPIEHVGGPMLISEVRIANKAEPDCAQRHWLTLKHNYSEAPYWKKFSGFFEQAYSQKWTMLIDLNMHVIKGVMQFLNIQKPLIMSSTLNVSGKGSERVLAECKALGASVQLSGIGAREYLNLERFKEEGIEVVFQDFHYPVYPQLHGSFVPNLSVVDYLFCAGGKMWRRADGTIGVD